MSGKAMASVDHELLKNAVDSIALGLEDLEDN